MTHVKFSYHQLSEFKLRSNWYYGNSRLYNIFYFWPLFSLCQCFTNQTLARRAGGFKRTKTIPPVHPASKNQIYVRYASLKNRRDFLWPRRITSSRWLVLKVRLTKAGQWVGRLEMNRRSWLGVAKATIVLCSHWNRKQYPINDVIDAVIVNDFVLALLIRPIMWGTFIAKLTHKLSYLKSILALHKVDMRGRQTGMQAGDKSGWCMVRAGRHMSG